MEYNCRTTGDTVEAALTGRLTFEDMEIFRSLITEMNAAGANRWIIDLTPLEFLDSAGLGLLLRAKAMADKGNGQLSLRVAPEGRVQKMMEVAKFVEMIPFES